MKKYLIWTLVVLALALTSPYILAEEYLFVEGTTLKFLPVPDLQPMNMGYFSEEYVASFVAGEFSKEEGMETIEDYGNYLRTVEGYTMLLEDIDHAKGTALYLFSATQEDTKLFVYLYLIEAENKFGQMVITSPAENFNENMDTLCKTATSLVWTGEDRPRITFQYSLQVPEGWNFEERVDTMDIYVQGERTSVDTPTFVVVDYLTPMEQLAIEGLLNQEDWDGDKILGYETVQLGDLTAILFSLEEEEEGVTTVNHGCFIFAEETTYFMMTLDQYMSAEQFKAIVNSFQMN